MPEHQPRCPGQSVAPFGVRHCGIAGLCSVLRKKTQNKEGQIQTIIFFIVTRCFSNWSSLTKVINAQLDIPK